MFEKIGKLVVGCFVVYFAMAVLSSMLVFGVASGAGGLVWPVLLIGGGALAYANRHRFLRPSSSKARILIHAQLPAEEDDAALRLAGYEERFAYAAAALAPRFPSDPLDDRAFLDVSYLYLHETEAERRALTDEYQSYRARALAWQDAVIRLHEHRSSLDIDGTPRRIGVLLPECEALDAELTAIQSYLSRLDERAREAQQIQDQASRAAAEATTALEHARAVHHAAAGRQAEPDLEARLQHAQAKLREVTAALDAGAPRPVTALRLATELLSEARALREQADRLAALPEEIGRRLASCESALARADRTLGRAKDMLAAAANEYSPSCWADIRGVGTAAERSLAQARQLWREAADRYMPDGADAHALDQLAGTLDEAFAALAQSEDHAGQITAHIELLEQTARRARETVERAEVELDRGWTAVHQGTLPDVVIERRRQLLERGAQLTAQAREELAKPLPDWLALVAWAERGGALGREAQVEAQPAEAGGEQDGAGDRLLLDGARERAKAARDRALALSWSVGSTELSSATRVLIDHADRSYQRAAGLADAIDARQQGPDAAPAIQAAIEAFRVAEGQAAAAYDQAWGEFSRPKGARGAAEPRAVPGEVAWGAVGSIVFEFLDGNG